MKICIIGSGVSGLSSAYFFLKYNPDSEIIIYEKNRIGGHAYTYTLNNKEKIDLGFQVFNKNSYPNMLKMFDDLNVDIQKSDMSLSVSNNYINWSSNLKSIIKNLINYKFLVLVYNMLYFNSSSKKFIEENYKNNMEITLNEYLNKNKYCEPFIKGFLIPFCSSVWSCPPDETLNFPTISILNFMNNHGLLNLNKDDWYTLKNRSNDYIIKILDKYKKQIKIINREPNVIKGTLVDNIKYDHLIIAIHGDKVPTLLPDSTENKIFERIKYSKSTCYLHQDINLMPKNKDNWASWNFLGDNEFICTYWCNRLQNDLKTKNLFFTLNSKKVPQNVIHKVNFDHPVYSIDLLNAQKEIELIQGKNNVWYVGAYLGNGFHEDGIVSALNVTKKILNKNIMIFKPLREKKSYYNNLLYSLILKIIKKLVHEDKIIVQVPNQGIHIINNRKNENQSEANLIINSPKFFYKILLHGDIGFADAYMNNYIDTNDITNLLNLFAKIQNNKETDIINLNILSYFVKLNDKIKFFIFKDNKIKNTKKNIADHYDLGNELYKNFLDSTMTYSSAIFYDLEIKYENLEKAQLNKYDRIINKLKINKNDHILEIGCGWGGFALRAYQKTGCKITCLTLSEEQKNYFEKKIGNNSNIEVLLIDYRLEKRKFDKIVSIEMIEAVGINYMDVYFNVISNNLKDNGLAMIQAICIPEERYEKYQKNVDFIQKYIFPGGVCPSLKQINNHINNNCMKVLDTYDITIDYANTLKIWHSQFEKNWKIIQKNWHQGDEYFYRMWKYYFAYCEVGFRNDLINTYQILFNKIIQ